MQPTFCLLGIRHEQWWAQSLPQLKSSQSKLSGKPSCFNSSAMLQNCQNKFFWFFFKIWGYLKINDTQFASFSIHPNEPVIPVRILLDKIFDWIFNLWKKNFSKNRLNNPLWWHEGQEAKSKDDDIVCDLSFLLNSFLCKIFKSKPLSQQIPKLKVPPKGNKRILD